MMARIEFYIGASPKHIVSLEDEVAPRVGEPINIRKITYLVERVTWAVDDADSITRCRLRANVELIPDLPDRSTL